MYAIIVLLYFKNKRLDEERILVEMKNLIIWIKHLNSL